MPMRRPGNFGPGNYGPGGQYHTQAYYGPPGGYSNLGDGGGSYPTPVNVIFSLLLANTINSNHNNDDSL